MKNHMTATMLGAILVIMTFVTANLNWGGQHWQSIVETDAKGYYAYLPAVFIYHDLNYGFFEKVEVPNTPPHFLYDYRVTVDGRTINKYFCGVAVAQLPFFLLAHTYCLLTDHPANGYSKPYSIGVTVAALFYLMLGLFFLSKTLNAYQVRGWAVGVTLLAATFGTSLFYYTVCEPGMSHIYSFGFVSMFIYLGKRFFETPYVRLLGALAVCLGIITLIRPTNVLLAAALPFLAGTAENLKHSIQTVLRKPISIIGSGLGFLVIAGIQIFIYKISTGNWFVYTYEEEGFNFLSPHMSDILFSYRKGLFLYTPLYFFMVVAAIWVWWEKRFQLLTFIGFFVLLTYVLSSWWSWWYGGSFSSRVYVEYLPFLCIPLAAFLAKGRSTVKQIAVHVGIFLLVALCQFQTYQYRYYLIHWEDMTKELYWNHFLRFEKPDVDH